ncbi:MAG TPA: class I SAM-dependent methyltransferase [bacterium]|nr:class I SAM-dependent methyltransferase [bacterium]HPO99616.1 class I SAM-dependent methyltransferase [bacterium]
MKAKKQADVYSAFAEIYDLVMRDVDYDSWARHVLDLAARYGIQVHKILELACGTGSMALRLAAQGYRVTGLDRSEEMLRRAREKTTAANVEVPFCQGDMEEFSYLALGRDFDLVLCLYDSLNYLLTEEGIRRCFQEVNRHLRPAGGFIFDVTTEYNLLHNFSGFTFAENFEEASYIWENEYNLAQKICSSKVTIFLQRHGRFQKHIEVHAQRVYATRLLMDLLQETGFEVLGTFHNLTLNPVKDECERIHFVCRKLSGS